MKYYFVIAIFAALFISCKSSSTENIKTSNINSVTINNTHPINTTSNVNNIATPTKTENSLSALKNMSGKTASQIKLFENKDISSRLEKLMGAKDYEEMKKYWNYEVSMYVEENVLSLVGAEKNNEIENQYQIYMDTANDNINVFHIIKKKLKSYTEKGEIKLPKNMGGMFEASKFPLDKN